MSRIRSIHPGLSTDEAYMAMSLAAKAAWPLLWTECDDDGVFEWKPLVLKAKIFPADNIDMGSVLKEYETLQCVKSYELDGRMYGVVRNFIRFQRPKKPNSRKLIPVELRTFVGLNEDGTRPVRNQFGTGGENQCQMEDEGGSRRKKEDSEIEEPPPSSATQYAFEDGIIRLSEKDFSKWQASFSCLDLRAELIGLSKWASEQQGNWFHAVKGALAKRNRTVLEARGKAKEFRTMSGMDGVL